MQETITRRTRIGVFEVDLGVGELRNTGRSVVLQEQPLRVLRMLIARPGKLVAREDIRKVLWPHDTVVGFDQGINTAIRKLREAFADSAEKPKYIETVARRGYRLIAPVEWLESTPGRPSMASSASVASLIGRKVSHYRVLEVLGGGGMGVVYKAEDLKLGRHVALKFLPEELADDPAALERFEREARAASALEHPNICPVYEFGEHDGHPFIAMQLLEGQTLRELVAAPLTPGPSPQGRGWPEGPGAGWRGTLLPIDKLLDLAIQIAGGLEAAHNQGIIHRDIKPANLFVLNRGDVKILDFGLAKLNQPLTPSPSPEGWREVPREAALPTNAVTASPPKLDLSKTGVAMGTAPYMSPEQVRGETLDARTDLFSFGLVLNEMATGHVAFAGNTAADVQEAILNRTPAKARDFNPDIPRKLEEIITKALEKNREARYQTASEMRLELARLRAETSSRQAGFRRKGTLLVALASGVVIVIGATIWLSIGRQGAQSTGPLRIVPFTGLPGLEDDPAISPDGKQLAYVWDGGSRTSRAQAAPHPPGHIYVKLIGAGAPLQLTHDALFDQDPAWSPDGRYIAFIRNANPSDTTGRSQVISIPALGGPEHRLAENDWPSQPGGRGLTWSPDGKSIVANTGSDKGLFLISVEDDKRRKLTWPPQGAWDTDPAFSHDGRTLAFVRVTGLYRAEIYSQNIDTAEAKRLTYDKADIWGLAWTPDGRDIVFSSKRSGFPTLWRIPASGGTSEPLAAVGANAFSPAVSFRSNVLAYVNQETNVNIWGIRIDPSGRSESEPRKLISGTGTQLDSEISPDGSRVAFASDRSGDTEIWVANIDGSSPVQLTSLHAPLAGSPRWSPDARWIVFGAMVDESGGAFVISAEGGAPRRLTPPGVMALVFAWSRDGKSIYFEGNPGGNWAIWKIPAQGGDSVRVVDGFECRESADGRWLYFSRPVNSAEDKTEILRMPVGGGPETSVFHGVTDRFWTLAGSNLYFLDVNADLHATVKRLDLTTRKITRIAEVQREPFVMHGWAGLSVSLESGWIIYPQVGEQISRIMLVENSLR